MYIYKCDTASVEDVAEYIREQKKILLDANREELSGLRFSILLTAKWEAVEGLPRARRNQLREELRHLRRIYLDKVDRIAMMFGVQKAMEVKEEIERSVEVPDEMDPAMMTIESEQLFF